LSPVDTEGAMVVSCKGNSENSHDLVANDSISAALEHISYQLLNLAFMKKINNKKVDTTVKKVDVTEKEFDSTEKELDATVTDKEQTQGPSTVNEEPDLMENHYDLFTQESVVMIQSSDDEDDSIDGFPSTKLDVMKRMSEVFKQSFTAENTYELTSDDSD